MNARKVIEKAPEKFRNIPNFGTIIENSPVIRTITLLYIIVFNLGYF